MFYALGLNFKIFLRILPGVLSIWFVIIFALCFPEHSIILWMIKISTAIFVVWKWTRKIKKHSKLKIFKPFFICTGIYWGTTIVFMILRNEITDIAIFLSGIFWVAGMILCYKVGNDSWTAIRKYDPKIKMNTEVRSVDDYFELYSRSEDVERKISVLKTEAPPAVVDAILQREAVKLIPFFNLTVMYLELLMLLGTSWMQ